MSEAQFVIYNDAGIEQISFGGTNLGLVHKETIGMGSWSAISGPQASGLKYSFTVNAVSPIVAIATSVSGQNGTVFSMMQKTGTNQWKISLYGGASTTTFSSPGVSTLNAQVVVYVFDAAPPPTSGPGLVLYDAAGKCIFNAAYAGARVLRMVDDGNNIHGYGTSVVVPAGKTYAAVQRSSWGNQIIGSRNPTTGDMIANTYCYGVSGGLPGATLQLGFGYSCLIDAQRSIAHAPSGSVGAIYSTFGCFETVNGFTSYIGDAMVIDVT